MKFFLFLCLVFFYVSTDLFAQTVLVTGIAVDTSLLRTGNGSVSIVRNDTLRKLYARPRKKIQLPMKTSESLIAFSEFQKYQVASKALMADTNWVIRSAPNGSFQMLADINDTLVFSALVKVPQKHAVRDLLARGKIFIELEPVRCPEVVPCKEKASKFIAFIGKKISVKGIPIADACMLFDSEYEATYEIIRVLDGNYNADTIKFKVYDHFGEPAFAGFTHVLLFAAEYCGQLTHIKYQFYPVYRTANGRWASPGDPYQGEKKPLSGSISTTRIKFADSVAFDIEDIKPHIVDRYYPAAYYESKNGVTKPVIGAYVEDLLIVKKQTTLRKYEFF